MLRVLCTGDLHLGRPPSRLPEEIDARAVSPSAVWGGCVEYAVENRVDAVVLCGDLVDRRNRFFEAVGPLERGLRRLAEHGIDTFAVAGNHDFDVLPRLADAIGAERFHLLGRGGAWERKALVRDGRLLAELVGWSFPRERVGEDPLDSLEYSPSSGVPVIGLLHTQVGAPGTPYAPTSLERLEDVRLAAWILGHVHSPLRYPERRGAPLVLYPGSPQPLDPTETGAHGPWLLRIDGPHAAAAELVALATLRYEVVDVDLDGVADPQAVEPAVVAAVDRRVETISSCDPSPLRHLLCRLRLLGRTRLHRRLAAQLENVSDLGLERGDITVTVERVLVETSPDLDLEKLAGSTESHAIAALARLISALRDGDPSGQPADPRVADLVERTRQRIEALRLGRAYAGLGSSDRTSATEAPDFRERLARQAARLLDALLTQKGA